MLQGTDLAGFMRDFKKFVSQKAFKDLGIKDQPVWQSRYDRVAIVSRDVLETKIDYIHQNPVRAGLAESPGQWRWSSAARYLGGRETGVKVYGDW